METNYKTYNFEKSLERLDEILDSTSSFADKDKIPKRSDLTYTNGYYVKCVSLFIDIRDSTNLPNVHQKRVLAKVYRSYISEVVAILNGKFDCKEINIVGDCVSAIFEAETKDQVNNAFSAASSINSIVNILNYKLEKKGYKPIKCGIGLSFGRVLMIKAGYNGSGLNDVVYMGDAVNKASKMCSKASKEISYPIVVTPDFYENLNQHNKGLLYEYRSLFTVEYYYGNVVHSDMNEWLEEQKEKDRKRQQNQSNNFYW